MRALALTLAPLALLLPRSLSFWRGLLSTRAPGLVAALAMCLLLDQGPGGAKTPG